MLIKIKYMKISIWKISCPNLSMNNTVLERVVNFNFLELLISSNAKWNHLIDHVTRKVS